MRLLCQEAETCITCQLLRQFCFNRVGNDKGSELKCFLDFLLCTLLSFVVTHTFTPTGLGLARPDGLIYLYTHQAFAMSAASLGGHRLISQSALSAVLCDLEKLDRPPSAISRRSIKRQREHNLDITTPFGKLLQSKTVVLPAVPKTKKERALQERTIEVEIVHPLALLYHLCQEAPDFGSMLRQCITAHQPRQDKPLGLLCYSDEITPGNVLAHSNERKVQIIYWSIKELGPVALGSERNWFTLSFCRSEHVKRMGGKMSQYFRICLETFFDPIDFRQGIQLVLANSEQCMAFGSIAAILGDEVALKEVMAMKGAAGTLPCPLCRNLVDHKSGLHLTDRSGTLVPSSEIDTAKFQFHSDNSILEVLDFLKRQKDLCSAARFSRMEQSLGFNWSPAGFLCSNTLQIQPVSHLHFDWMHLYCVGGIWACEVGLLLPALAKQGIDQSMIHTQLQTFSWPKAWSNKGVTGKKVFSKEQSGDVKCSASEVLSVYSPLRYILLEIKRNGSIEALTREVDSYCKLCRVLDLLIVVKKGLTTGPQLQSAIVNHLKAFKNAYTDSDGVIRFVPKHHHCLHLGGMLSAQGTLWSCWCHERKHRELKRHANLVTNTWSRWEKNVLIDSMNSMMESLRSAQVEPFYGGLSNPSEPSAGILQTLRRALQEDGIEPVMVSRSAYYGPGAHIFTADAVLFELGNVICVGEVLFFAQAGNDNFARVQRWQPQGQNRFSRRGLQPCLVDLNCIRDVCVFADREDCMVVVPSSTWT